MERIQGRTVRITRKSGMLDPAAKAEILLRGLPEPGEEDRPEEDLDDIMPDGEEPELNIAAMLARGQTAEFVIPGEACVLCPMVRKWSGVTLGPTYSVPAGTEDIRLELSVRRALCGGIALRLTLAQRG